MGTVYFYDSHTHAVATANSSPDSLLYPDYLFYESELHLGIGLHGPYNSLAALHSANPGSEGASPIPGASAVGTTPQAAASDALKSANPLAGLFQKAIWLRVGEVVVGLILLGIGMNALLKGKPMTFVTGAAGTVGKAAML